VGIGKAVNGGFGLVLDGSERVDHVIRRAIPWDAMGGVARRAWARNEAAIETCVHYNDLRAGSDHVTLPYLADEGLLEGLVAEAFERMNLNG
jgi:urocanate hydratase